MRAMTRIYFFYREILSNQNATFNDTDGTVTYNPHRDLIFIPEMSVGDPKIDRMITTNIPLVVSLNSNNLKSIMNMFPYSHFKEKNG